MYCKGTNTNMNIQDLESTLQNDSYINQMLEYFEIGWHERGIDDKKNFQSRIIANIDNTVTYTKRIVDEFKKLKLSVNGAYLKLERPNSLLVLITVPLDTLINEQLLEIYSFTRNIERHSRSDDYRVAFSITHNDGELDRECLLSDGFVNFLSAPNE